MGGSIVNSMIYYPGFEVENETWLKFSLLYFDELRPIIPYMYVDESKYLSKTAIRVSHDTDLIHPYQPSYEESACASVIACEEFQRYLEHPELYSTYFSNRYPRINLRDKWENPEYWNCKLYMGKFSNVFYDFCIKNNIAASFNNGILISKDLAFTYMSFLADIISKNNELEMFTDVSKYNTLLLRHDLEITKSQGLKYNLAKANIEFNIPINICNIPLEVFIDLRKKKDFGTCRHAYVHEINNLIKAKNEKRLDYSLEQLLSLKKDFIHICGSAFNMIASVVLTVSSVSSLINGNANTPELLASAYSDAYSLKSIYQSKNFIDNLRSKVQAKRYLAKIDKAINQHGK